MKRVLASLFVGGIIFHAPAGAGPLPFAEMLHGPAVSPALTAPATAPAAAPTATFNLWTTWGYGQRENLFNDLIVSSIGSVWQDVTNPLPPVLYKSLVAVESSFNPRAVSPAGAAGLTQLMPDTARRFGLKGAERLDPAKAVPAGIQAFQEKYKVVLEPANYSKIIGLPPEKVAFSTVVAEFYETQGPPQGEDRWHLALAAYNGGGGTILRAMAYAVQSGLDPRSWDNLAGEPGKALNTPLHKACIEVFGPRAADRKVFELAAYPRKIMGLYHSKVAGVMNSRGEGGS